MEGADDAKPTAAHSDASASVDKSQHKPAITMKARIWFGGIEDDDDDDDSSSSDEEKKSVSSSPSKLAETAPPLTVESASAKSSDAKRQREARRKRSDQLPSRSDPAIATNEVPAKTVERRSSQRVRRPRVKPDAYVDTKGKQPPTTKSEEKQDPSSYAKAKATALPKDKARVRAPPPNRPAPASVRLQMKMAREISMNEMPASTEQKQDGDADTRGGSGGDSDDGGKKWSRSKREKKTTAATTTDGKHRPETSKSKAKKKAVDEKEILDETKSERARKRPRRANSMEERQPSPPPAPSSSRRNVSVAKVAADVSISGVHGTNGSARDSEAMAAIEEPQGERRQLRRTTSREQRAIVQETKMTITTSTTTTTLNLTTNRTPPLITAKATAPRVDALVTVQPERRSDRERRSKRKREQRSSGDERELAVVESRGTVEEKTEAVPTVTTAKPRRSEAKDDKRKVEQSAQPPVNKKRKRVISDGSESSSRSRSASVSSDSSSSGSSSNSESEREESSPKSVAARSEVVTNGLPPTRAVSSEKRASVRRDKTCGVKEGSTAKARHKRSERHPHDSDRARKSERNVESDNNTESRSETTTTEPRRRRLRRGDRVVGEPRLSNDEDRHSSDKRQQRPSSAKRERIGNKGERVSASFESLSSILDKERTNALYETSEISKGKPIAAEETMLQEQSKAALKLKHRRGDLATESKMVKVKRTPSTSLDDFLKLEQQQKERGIDDGAKVVLDLGRSVPTASDKPTKEMKRLKKSQVSSVESVKNGTAKSSLDIDAGASSKAHGSTDQATTATSTVLASSNDGGDIGVKTPTSGKNSSPTDAVLSTARRTPSSFVERVAPTEVSPLLKGDRKISVPEETEEGAISEGEPPIPRRSDKIDPEQNQKADENANNTAMATSDPLSFVIPKKRVNSDRPSDSIGSIKKEDLPPIQNGATDVPGGRRSNALTPSQSPTSSDLNSSAAKLTLPRKVKPRTKNYVPVLLVPVTPHEREFMRLANKSNSFLKASSLMAPHPGVPTFGPKDGYRISAFGCSSDRYGVLNSDGSAFQETTERMKCLTRRQLKAANHPSSFFGVKMDPPSAAVAPPESKSMQEAENGTNDKGEQLLQPSSANVVPCYETLEFADSADRDWYQERMYGTAFVPSSLRVRTTLVMRNARYQRSSSGMLFNSRRNKEDYAENISKRYTINRSVPRCDILQKNWQLLVNGRESFVFLHYMNREDALLACESFCDDRGQPLEIKGIGRIENLPDVGRRVGVPTNRGGVTPPPAAVAITPRRSRSNERPARPREQEIGGRGGRDAFRRGPRGPPPPPPLAAPPRRSPPVPPPPHRNGFMENRSEMPPMRRDDHGPDLGRSQAPNHHNMERWDQHSHGREEEHSRGFKDRMAPDSMVDNVSERQFQHSQEELRRGGRGNLCVYGPGPDSGRDFVGNRADGPRGRSPDRAPHSPRSLPRRSRSRSRSRSIPAQQSLPNAEMNKHDVEQAGSEHDASRSDRDGQQQSSQHENVENAAPPVHIKEEEEAGEVLESSGVEPQATAAAVNTSASDCSAHVNQGDGRDDNHASQMSPPRSQGRDGDNSQGPMDQDNGEFAHGRSQQSSRQDWPDAGEVRDHVPPPPHPPMGRVRSRSRSRSRPRTEFRPRPRLDSRDGREPHYGPMGDRSRPMAPRDHRGMPPPRGHEPFDDRYRGGRGQPSDGYQRPGGRGFGFDQRCPSAIGGGDDRRPVTPNNNYNGQRGGNYFNGRGRRRGNGERRYR